MDKRLEEKLPEGWEVVTLGEILPLSYGKSLTKPNRDSLGIIGVYGSSGKVGTHSSWLTSGATLIIGRKGSVGSVYLSEGKCWPIDTVFFVEPSEHLNSKFWFHYLTHLNLGRLDQSTAIPSLSRDIYSAVPVGVPSSTIQDQIASKIDGLFSDIEVGEANLERAKTLVKKYRQSVLKAAVTGELTKEWREQNAGNYETGEVLLDRILKARRLTWEEAELAKMKASGKEPKNDKWKAKYREPATPDTADLPELPEGWIWATLTELTVDEPRNGISVKGSNVPPGTPALKLDALTDNGIDYQTRRYIDIPELKATTLEIRDADFLISRANGSLRLCGKACLAENPPDGVVFPDTIIRFRLSRLGSLTRWIELIWSGRFVREQIEARAKTSAGIWKVSQGDLGSIVLPLPSPYEIDECISFIELAQSNATSSTKMVELAFGRSSALRQSILKSAFSGQLVPQDPNDEPASELMKRIDAERARRP